MADEGVGDPGEVVEGEAEEKVHVDHVPEAPQLPVHIPAPTAQQKTERARGGLVVEEDGEGEDEEEEGDGVADPVEDVHDLQVDVGNGALDSDVRALTHPERW